MIGDSLMRDDKEHAFWLQALAPKGGKLDQADLKQQAAVPLGSFLRYDPWTDQVIALHTAFEPLLMPADKMPFEVEPVYLKLSYYKAPADPGAAAAALPPTADAAPTGVAVPPDAPPAATQPQPH